MPVLFFSIIALVYSCIATITLIDSGKLSYVLAALGICLLAAIGFISLIFIFALKINRYDIIDAAWGPTFIVVSFTSYLIAYNSINPISLSLLVVALVMVWGLRLAWHIGKRKIGSTAEDPRYVELRRHWRGKESFNVYFRIYITQALLATIICIPVIHINLFDGNQWAVFTYLGLVVWILGFVFEVVADRQLKAHLDNTKNKGTIMQSGLWRYSRHPNYFGEIIQWWGIGIIAMGVMPWWVGLIGPITITFLILYVSGIPPTEKRFEGRASWSQYKAKTSMIVPLPIKDLHK